MSKPRTQKDMIQYLQNHDWRLLNNNFNHGRLFSRNVKISNLRDVDEETRNKAYEFVDVEEAFYDVNDITSDFSERWNYKYQIAFDGRSGGHMVLRRGGSKPSAYKSYCPSCGQRNFQSVEDGVSEKCGACGKPRVNFKTPPVEIYVTFDGVDISDIEEWDKDSLKNMVDVVWDFDKTVDMCIGSFLDFVRENTIVEETVMVPKVMRCVRPITETTKKGG